MQSKDWPAYNVERRRLADLLPYVRNAKLHPKEQVDRVAASMKEFGWTTPCLVDEKGELIAGHCRTLAAKALGLTEAPVIVARGWTEAQKRAYRLADNKLTESPWDSDLLKFELAELKALDFDLSLTGFTLADLDGIFAERMTPVSTVRVAAISN